MKYKTDFVREQFPAFSEPSLKRWLHFENAGGSYMAGAVVKALRNYNRETRVQPYYSYPASKEAGRKMDEAYEILAQILNIDEDWVHIGPSTTAHSYALAQAMRGWLKAGENIIVTNQDHEANSGYWRRLADEGIELREWTVRETGLLDPEDLWPLIDENTRFAAFPHVSNIIGQINPVSEICAQLRAKNVRSIVDGVSYAPHAWPDIQEIGADVYFFSAYKTYGPHQGVMIMDPTWARILPNQSHDFNADDLRKKFNPAGPDHSQVAGIGALARYIKDVYVKHFKSEAELGEMARELGKLQRKHETKLLAVLFEGLAEMPEFQVLGTTDTQDRVPTVSLYSSQMRGIKMAKQLTKMGIMSAGGDFYAPRILRALKIDPDHGVLRLSFVHYTTLKDIEKLLKALRKVPEKLVDGENNTSQREPEKTL